ncbi:ABC transporter ATP-binding protein [Collinsella sp. zg1085]|uniref:ABC transporter ATP-binding protein n=1 Tax=Collinsella sp. zg1085 TaxID=2844380 RepID=UPI001C0C8711|nr:ABC transporter ATP-binding protein [Collinsella sp. zg1085]QWT17423.1 ABC transporter ATP-binding protein [Collinsella sp. zg1085]
MRAHLEVDKVSVGFGDLAVLEDITLRVDAGQIACVLGPSGCGKTTLFHVIAGLDTPDSGDVLLEGLSVVGQPGAVGYMLQKDLLLPHKTVLDNVALPLILRGLSKEQARQRAAGYLDTFGLAGTEQLWPASLSGGMRQRAAFLRTFLFNQNFLLLDEPFSALDSFTKQELHAWFLRVCTEFHTTALIVTHDIDEALMLADVVYVLKGAPRQGVPTRVAGCTSIVFPRTERLNFSVQASYLEAKREVLALLESPGVNG